MGYIHVQTTTWCVAMQALRKVYMQHVCAVTYRHVWRFATQAGALQVGALLADHFVTQPSSLFIPKPWDCMTWMMMTSVLWKFALEVTCTSALA